MKLRHGKEIMISSVVILLPMIFSLIVWDRIPEQIATHWGIDGEPDGWSSKMVGLVVIPFFLLLVHLVCLIAVLLDPRNRGLSDKIFRVVIWLCPVLSLIINPYVTLSALGYEYDITNLMSLLIGIMFIILGNYMPKTKRNYTVGIKLPWTLNSDENWRRTHRVGGIAMVACGVVVLFTPFLSSEYVLLGAIILAALIPMVYSFVYYLRHERGKEEENASSHNSQV